MYPGQWAYFWLNWDIQVGYIESKGTFLQYYDAQKQLNFCSLTLINEF